MIPHYRPDIRPEHHQSERSACLFLLMRDVSFGRNQHLESGRFRRLQQFAIFKLWMPLHPGKGAHIMPGQEAPHTERDVLVKDDAQRGDSYRNLG